MSAFTKSGQCSDLLDDVSDPVIRSSPAADRHIAAKNQVFHATAPWTRRKYAPLAARLDHRRWSPKLSQLASRRSGALDWSHTSYKKPNLYQAMIRKL